MSDTGSESPAQADAHVPTVGIGASAGGLAALEAFFSAVTPDIGARMTFVVVQHISPEHESMLARSVGRFTSMEVHQAADGMTLSAGSVYVIPPDRDMILRRRRLYLLAPAAPRGLRLPIDVFFRSMAEDQGARAIGVVLSGNGTDGTLGGMAIKEAGGMVMAQSPETAAADGMPRSAIASGLVDYVLAPDAMPVQLAAYVEHALAQRPRPLLLPAARENTLDKICAVIRARTSRDFSRYKHTSLVRRIERRMALYQIEDPDDYLALLEESPPEVDSLFQDLLIGVTSFFRDPDAFESLSANVISRLVASRAPGSTFRVWVCGCSTGEEAYSIAMVFLEYIQRLDRPYKLQVFATDIDASAIETARAGIYPESIAADVSSERLDRFFLHDPELGIYRVRRTLRDQLVFSEQDVLDDPPFSRLDLITCRNLLIYLGVDAQKSLIGLFHYALDPHGFLFLGTSETVGELSTCFVCVDRKWKIYERRGSMATTLRPSFGLRVHDRATRQLRSIRPSTRPESERVDLGAIVRTGLLAHYTPAAILVNGRGDILHIHGRTGMYLEPAPGDAEMNVLDMAREGLDRALSMALRKAVSRRATVSEPGLSIKSNGTEVTVDLAVRPISASNQGDKPSDMYLVIIEPVPGDIRGPESTVEAALGAEVGTAGPFDPDSSAAHVIARLRQELQDKEAYLKSTLEEMDLTNEELRTTNEEMQSINEELQSSNEELETSKEELQSVNEELQSVNAELHTKLAELSRVNNDMNNLLAGTGVATLFVDHELCIARFTPTITEVINLIQADVGRPVGHIVSNLMGYDSLVEDVREVLETLVPREATVRTRNGSMYLMNIRPYRTLDNVIEGAVITFVNITAREHKQKAWFERHLRAALAELPVIIALCDRQLRYTWICDPQSSFAAASVIGKRDDELAQNPGIDALIQLKREVVDTGEPARAEIAFPLGDGDTTYDISAQPIRDESGRVIGVSTVATVVSG